MTGLCHGFNGAYQIADLLGFEREHFTFELTGVNHFLWMTRLFYKGQDALPQWQEWVEKQSAEYFKTCGSQDPNTRMLDYLKPEHSGEQMVPIIHSIACDAPRIYYVNTPNTGNYVPGIPTDFAVEIPALVSARGIQGIQTGGLPPLPLAYALRDRVSPVNLELEAYRLGSRRMLEELIEMDPWTRSAQQAHDLLAGILAMDEHAEMREHYQ